MSQDPEDKVGPGRPPKQHQFKPGQSGNRRGRPPKPIHLLAPSQIRRTVLAVLDEPMSMSAPIDPTKITKFEALIRNLITNAAKGNPTATIWVMKLLIPALAERLDAHSQVLVAEVLRNEVDKPLVEDVRNARRAAKAHIKAVNGKY